MTIPTFRLFVSSPGDVVPERQRVAQVVERLNGEFAGRARIDAVLWEEAAYSAHAGFQDQIAEAADCDVVIAIFRARLGQPLPEDFQGRRGAGRAYPSGTAYEVLTAIEARRAGGDLPDVYVFRYPNNPTPGLDDPNRPEIEAQWTRLKSFIETWFRGPGGEFLSAFQDYASIDDLAAQAERALRQFLARHGFDARGPAWDRLRLGSPFPGLAAFGPALALVFFGRDLATAQCLDRLRQAGTQPARLPFLLILGASGSGKSSLLRAALLPRLALPGTVPEIDLWRPALLTPGPDPFLALAERLLDPACLGDDLQAAGFTTPPLLARLLAAGPDLALAPLRAALAAAAARRQAKFRATTPAPTRLLLAIDQAERLFSETPPEAAAAFATLLAALVEHGLAYAIMVLRSDAYARFQASPPLLALRDAGATFDLVPPGPAELEEMVVRPVQSCDPPLAFADPTLPPRLARDAKGGDALPLLQMTLSRLYDAQASRDDGLLRPADYHGVDAAVIETAAEALAALPPLAQAALPALLAALVTDIVSDPQTNAPTPLLAPLDRDAFTAARPERAALLDAFIARRLLTSEGAGARTLVRPTHEALLRIWPDAVAILADLGPLLRVRLSLTPLVQAWQSAPDAEKPTHLELSPALLAGAQLLAVRLDIPPEMAAFIQDCAGAASAREQREREEQARKLRDAQALARARRRIAVSALAGLAAALVLAVVAGWQWHQADFERTQAEAERSQALMAKADALLHQAEAEGRRREAEAALTAGTEAANALVFDLAYTLRNKQGIPVDLIRSILETARKLQDRLILEGTPSPALRRGQAAALLELATTLFDQGQTAPALRAANDAWSILKALADQSPDSNDYQRDLSIASMKVGDILVAQGDLPTALIHYQMARLILELVAMSDTGNTGLQRYLSASLERTGNIAVAQGNLPDALAAYRAAQTIRDRLAQSDPGNTEWQRDLSFSYTDVGDVLAAQGNLPDALAAYRAAQAISERGATSDPGNTGWQADLSVSYVHIGDVLRAQGNLPDALAAYRAAQAINERLATSDPGNTGWQRNLSTSYIGVGDFLVAQGNLPDALAAYRAAQAISERLAKSDPLNTGWQSDLSVDYSKVGDVLMAQGNLPDALSAYRAGQAISERLAKSDPGNAGWQHDLSVFYNDVGDVLGHQGMLSDAFAAYRAAQDIIERLANSAPGNAGWQRSLAVSYTRIAGIALEQGQPEQARQALTAARLIVAPLVQRFPDERRWKDDLAFIDGQLAALPTPTTPPT